MEIEPHQPNCPGEEYDDIRTGDGDLVCRVRVCCPSDPSPVELRRRADDAWLARQRHLATTD